MFNKIVFLLSVVISLTAVFPISVKALPGDNLQPIKIQADHARIDEKKGQTVYTGNVSIQQGSIQIQADKVIIESADGKAEKLTAEGKPAHYQQQPQIDKDPVVATANTLKYNLADEILHLITNASVTQEGAVISGARIAYDVANAVVKADSGSQDDNAQQSGRVTVVIPPSINTKQKPEAQNEQLHEQKPTPEPTSISAPKDGAQ
ncbi:MAG: lipopolysaccharide transport periplasmic protein LptA [Cellvibrionaceae bacterium]